MAREVVAIPGLSDRMKASGVPLSPVVRANGFVFVAGLPPMDLRAGGFVKGDITAQTECCLDHLRTALEAAGSALEKVVKVTVFITNAAHFRAVNDVYRRYFPTDPPARTFVNVGSWPAEFDIEIECIALA